MKMLQSPPSQFSMLKLAKTEAAQFGGRDVHPCRFAFSKFKFMFARTRPIIQTAA